MIKFVHTGDIHLGLQFKTVFFDREKATLRREELWTSFQRIVQYSIDKEANFLFIAGDLFEYKYFSLGDMKRLRDILKVAKDVNVIIVAGNHDYLGRNSLYRQLDWPENVTIFHSEGLGVKEFPDLKTKIYGYSWDRLEIREDILTSQITKDDEGYKRILVLHGDLARDSNYLPLDINKLRNLNMDYIALGHIHKPQIFDNRIAYCGSPEPLDFGETGERGFIEGQIQNGKTNISFIPFSRRRFIIKDLEINENMSYQDIFNKIVNIDQGNKKDDFYRLNLKGLVQNDLDMEGLISRVKEEFYYLEISDDTRPDYDLEELERTYEHSIIGMFIKTMRDKGLEDQQVKDSLYIGLEALLKGRLD